MWRSKKGFALYEVLLGLAIFALGVLALGRKESVAFTPFADSYTVVDAAERIYRKTA